MKTHRNPGRALVAAAGIVATGAAAQAAPPTPPSSYTLTTNVGLVSQYVFRGVSYTQERPAVQGGVDLAHASGWYAGLWGSSISGKAIQNATGEIDLYGGYATTIGAFGVDAGVLQFTFPGGRYDGTGQNYQTTELNLALSWQMFKLKYSHTLSDYFGFNDRSFGAAGNGSSKGSGYLELNASFDLGNGWSVDAHVGRQRVEHYAAYSFTDLRLGVASDLGQGWRAALAWADTNADRALYTIDGVHTGDGKLVASIVRSF
ncbi:MAG: hypothetical protein JSR59_16950 [Proteobacteria bacterium]|nr:hypothetical protein [Pseudomonadota bacterium]